MPSRGKPNFDPTEFLSIADDRTAQSRAADFVKENPGESYSMMMMLRAVSLNFQSQVSDLVSGLEKRIVDLESRCADLEDRNAHLEDRVLAAEAYSGRATLILTGVPEAQGEDTRTVVADVLREVLPSLSASDLSTAHRNRPNSSGKARSITVVLKSIWDRDYLSDFRNNRPLRDRGVGVYHYASPAIRARRTLLEGVEGVDRVYFDGPNRLFSVKLKSGHFVRGVLSVGQLLAACEKL